MYMFPNRKCSLDKYKIFADYGTTGLWFLDTKSGVWLSCDPNRDMSPEFKQTLDDWMAYFKADRIRTDRGIYSGCITLRMFNAIGETLAQQLQRETETMVFYQAKTENELFYKIINDPHHIDNTIKI